MRRRKAGVRVKLTVTVVVNVPGCSGMIVMMVSVPRSAVPNIRCAGFVTATDKSPNPRRQLADGDDDNEKTRGQSQDPKQSITTDGLLNRKGEQSQ